MILGIVMGVEYDQVVVDRAHRLGHHEGLLLMHVQAWRITRQGRIQEYPPAAAGLSQLQPHGQDR